MKDHYSSDKEKQQHAVAKRNKTILENWGDGYSAMRQGVANKFYKQEQDKICNAELVSKDDVASFLEVHGIEKFKGRGGNRKLKSLNLPVYKSIIHYTDEFVKYNNNKSIAFSGRLDIAYKGFKLEDSDLCYCGKRIKFDPTTQEWTKLYCMDCRRTGTSKSHFKYKYGGEWEKMYAARNVSGAITRGNNEECLLNKIEEDLSITIDREFRLLNFYPDGYCKENNTIYEVYEPAHKQPKRAEKDKMRQQILQDYLKCDFCIIWDDGSDRIELHKYVQTK